jgi:cytochrome P450
MLAHARQMRSDPLAFLVECAAEQGDVVEFPIPRQRVFYVNDADAAARVLQGNHRGYSKQTIQYRSLALVTGQGLLVSDGDDWLRGRRLVQPAFHHRTLEALGKHVADAGGRLVADWQARPPGSVLDVDAAMMHSTLEVVGQSLFSTDLGPSASELVSAVLAGLDQVVARARSPLPVPLSWPTPGNRRLRSAVATLDRRVAEMVQTRRSMGSSGLLPGSGGDDLLGLLLAASPEDAPSAQLRDQVVTLIVAGQETVASALTWAWWLVAGDRAVAQRLAAESQQVIGDREPTLADYSALLYARQVIDETLRLYPPAWVITRRALEPDVLAGVPIPAGALVILSTYALHRHPAVWPDPERFDPDRFAGPDRGRPGYLPFGAGPRMCLGRDFALVEAVLLLSTLAGRFALSRRPGQVVRPDPLVTVRPRGGLELALAPAERLGCSRTAKRTGSAHVDGG